MDFLVIMQTFSLPFLHFQQSIYTSNGINMFSNHETLVRKSGKKGIDRPDFIRELIEEYKNSDDKGMHS